MIKIEGIYNIGMVMDPMNLDVTIMAPWRESCGEFNNDSFIPRSVYVSYWVVYHGAGESVFFLTLSTLSSR